MCSASVIQRERKGDFLGRTVKVVPHITDAVQEWIERVAFIPVDDTKEEPGTLHDREDVGPHHSPATATVLMIYSGLTDL